MGYFHLYQFLNKFGQIYMDFVEGLPIFKSYSVIMVAINRFSKYAYFLDKVAKVASIFLDNTFKLHGMSKSIVYDKGSTFTSSFWREFCKLQGVNLSYSLAYNPQSDGQTEAVNKCLEHF